MAQGRAPARRGLRIGVTGHRKPPKLPQETLSAVRGVLGRVLDTLPVEGAVVVSSLAQGADQIVAEEALALGATLHAILPFSATNYRRDFMDAGTQARFDALLARAGCRDELDYDRANETEAYEAAGYAMLAASDVLIAVWDGEDADGRGGTAHIVERALECKMPVILINPKRPERIALEDAGDREIGFNALATLAERLSR